MSHLSTPTILPQLVAWQIKLESLDEIAMRLAEDIDMGMHVTAQTLWRWRKVGLNYYPLSDRIFRYLYEEVVRFLLGRRGKCLCIRALATQEFFRNYRNHSPRVTDFGEIP